jgi:hypothetical protein
MSIYTTSQSILIPSTMTRMVVQLYGAGGGGEGVVSSDIIPVQLVEIVVF